MQDLKPLMRDTMEVRPYKPDNHKILASWWTAREWPIIPEDYLPKTGFVAWSNDHPIAAVFLYKTDSKFGFMDWLISSPTADYELRTIAINHLLDIVYTNAKDSGISAIYTMTNHANLKKRYSDHGFLTADTEMTAFVKRIE